MKIINTLLVDTSPMRATKTLRNYTIKGDPGAMFSLRVINKSQNYYYNFPENTDVNFAPPPAPAFVANIVELNTKTIDSSGTYNGFISFPAITGNNGYKITLLPKGNTMLNSSLSFEKNYESPVYIKQYNNTAVAFSLLHTNSAVVEPSNIVSTGANSVMSTGGTSSFSIDWDLTLSSSQCVIIRQPIITDFEFAVVRKTRTSKTSDLTNLEITDITGLSVGMSVSGTNINAAIITSIKQGYYDATNSTGYKPVYIIPTVLETNVEGKTVSSLDKGGTITLSAAADNHVADRNITFTGKGSSHAKKYNNTDFEISNFALTIDPVVTTLDAVASNSTTIPLTSTNGIKAAETVLMTGIGVTAASPHVDTVNAGVSVDNILTVG